MANSLLSASPSWYASRICDCLPSGLLCYGGSNSLFLYDISGSVPKYHAHFAAHTSRVTSVALCKYAESTYCCSSGEDGKIRVHNYETKKLIHEHAKHKGLPCVLDWSSADQELIVSADDRGGILTWQPPHSDPQLILHENSKVTALACSPHDASLLVVGYKSGLVLVLDISRSGEIVHRLRGHDEEIHGVCWAPRRGEKQDAADTPSTAETTASPQEQGCLIASGSRDRTVRVWSSLSGRCLHTLRLPNPSQAWHRGKAEDKNSRIWTAVHWPTQKHLVSSGFNGEVLSWDLNKPGKNKSTAFSSGSLQRGHHRIVFSICSTGGAAGGAGFKVITSGMDRQHVVWDLDSLCGRSNIPSLGGFSYCLAQSPINPGRLAIGCGDNVIRVWNVDKPDNPLEIQTLWQGIKSKVTAAAWHPDKEGWLAYGTDDGRVGIYNVLNNKAPTLSSTFHKQTVYVVSWGPFVGPDVSSQSGISLYSLGDGIILQHRPQRLEEPAMNINELITATNQMEGRLPGRSEISWKPDLSVVAIGNDDGSIEIFRPPDLQRLCVIHVHRKIINQIRWHPEYTAADPAGSPSPFRYWLATGSNDPSIHIIDTRPYIAAYTENVMACGDTVLPPVRVVHSDRELTGHTHRITGLCWSPHHAARLVSASFDNTAQVWNVTSATAQANFRGHNGRLLSVAWSDLDPDLVYSGGQDNTVQAWRPSQQQTNAPPESSYHEKKKFSKGKGKGRGKVSSEVKEEAKKEEEQHTDYADQLAEVKQLIEQRKRELAQKVEEPAAVEESLPADDPQLKEKLNTLLGRTKMADMPATATDEKLPESSQPEEVVFEGYKDMKKDQKKKKKTKALWSSSNNLDNRGKSFLLQDCLDLLPYTTAQNKGKEEKGEEAASVPRSMYHVGHFVNRKSTLQLLDMEGGHHEETGNLDQHLVLDMYKGDMAASLKATAEKGQLSDWHLALAASVSPSLWRMLCGKYAVQLEKAGSFQKSATFHLAKNDVYGAIDMLKRNNQYKDAACIARLRLIECDPAIEQVYVEWAEAAILEGSFELAARCYLCLQRPLEAARMLMRRSDLTALRAATYVALTSGDLEVTSAYASKFVTQCLVKWDWASAADVISQHECFMVHGLSSSVHETIVRQLASMQLLGEPLDDACFHHPQDSDSFPAELPRFPVEDQTRDPLTAWPACTMSGEALVMHVLKLWRCTWHVALNPTSLLQLYRLLMAQRGPQIQHNTPLRQVLVTLAVEVALGIVKLAVCEREDACYHWALAISAALKAGQQELAVGLCRLLLPQGPCYLHVLERQVPSILDQQKATSAVSQPKPEPEIAVETPSDETTVSSQQAQYTAYGALRTYYAYCVLQYFLRAKLGQKTETETETKETATACESKTSCSVNGQTEVLDGARNGPETELVAGLESLHLSGFSVSLLKTLSRALLWDCQLERCKLQDALVYIQKAISALILTHGRQKVMETEGIVQDMEEGDKVSELKAKETSILREDAEDVVQASGPEPKPVTTEDIVLQEGRGGGREGNEGMQNAEQVQVEVHCGDEQEEELEEEEKEAPCSPLLAAILSSAALDEEFCECSLPDLTAQQSAITARLQQINAKDLPFPDMFVNVQLLLQACSFLPATPQSHSLRSQILQWASQRVYTMQQVNWLTKAGLQEAGSQEAGLKKEGLQDAGLKEGELQETVVKEIGQEELKD